MKKMNSDKLNKIADTMDRQAEEKLRPRETHTAKKLKQARQAEMEGQHLKRAAALIRSFARAASEDRVPAIVQDAWPFTKDLFMRATKMQTQRVSNGFHDYLVETSEYYFQDPLYESLRSLDDVSPEQDREMQHKSKEIELRRAIDSVRNRNIPGFFPTPLSVIRRMLSVVDRYLVPGADVLEPSAGLGDIVDQIKSMCPSANVEAIELQPSLCEILRMKNIRVEQADFMTWGTDKQYDCIVMNPPYETKQAVKHSTKAYQHLKPGGALVSLMPPNHAEQFVSNLMSDGCCVWAIEPMDDGAFTKRDAFRRTGVSVAIVYAVKHDEEAVIDELFDHAQGLLF